MSSNQGPTGSGDLDNEIGEETSPLVIRKWPPMRSLPADDPIFTGDLLILSPIPLGGPRNIPPGPEELEQASPEQPR